MFGICFFTNTRLYRRFVFIGILIQISLNPSCQSATAVAISTGQWAQVTRLPQRWASPICWEGLAIGSLVDRLRFSLGDSLLRLKVQAEG
jgi:hypothetical protein